MKHNSATKILFHAIKKPRAIEAIRWREAHQDELFADKK